MRTKEENEKYLIALIGMLMYSLVFVTGIYIMLSHDEKEIEQETIKTRTELEENKREVFERKSSITGFETEFIR